MVSKPSGSVCTYHHSVLTACKHFKSRVNAGDSAIQLQGKTMRQAAALENQRSVTGDDLTPLDEPSSLSHFRMSHVSE